MTDVLWPGDERAGDVFSGQAFVDHLVAVESAWLEALGGAGIAPRDARIATRVSAQEIATDAESAGNPVVPLVALLRARADEEHRDWVHRGLTSQDVVDTALVLCARDARARLLAELDAQVDVLSRLAETHRGSVMSGRTLTQHAVPVTFGLKAATWLTGILDARDALDDVRLPAQLGGAAGTLAATTTLARHTEDPAGTALTITRATAHALGLEPATPWQTSRGPVTRFADAVTTATDAWGRIANDVLTLARPEIGELAEPAGRGGSSTMPQKANPILSVLVRRTALGGPGLAAQLHLAASETVDERADGAWHLEWSTLATLARRAVVAGAQVTELLGGLHVDTDRMAATAAAAAHDLLAEQRSLDPGASGDLADYLGATDVLIDLVLARARQERP